MVNNTKVMVRVSANVQIQRTNTADTEFINDEQPKKDIDKYK